MQNLQTHVQGDTPVWKLSNCGAGNVYDVFVL